MSDNETPRRPLRKVEISVLMNDGVQHDLIIGNPDMLRYDNERARRGWPAHYADAVTIWQTYIAWANMTRLGLLDGMPFEAFTLAAENITVHEAPKVDPTPPAPEAG